MSEHVMDQPETESETIERERSDRDAFYFLTAVLIIIMTVILFKTEILQFISANVY